MSLWSNTTETSGGNLNRAETIKVIKACYKRTGNFPTARQLMAELGITSTGVIAAHLKELVQAGMVVRVGEKGVRTGCYTLPSVLRALKSL